MCVCMCERAGLCVHVCMRERERERARECLRVCLFLFSCGIGPCCCTRVFNQKFTARFLMKSTIEFTTHIGLSDQNLLLKRMRTPCAETCIFNSYVSLCTRIYTHNSTLNSYV